MHQGVSIHNTTSKSVSCDSPATHNSTKSHDNIFNVHVSTESSVQGTSSQNGQNNLASPNTPSHHFRRTSIVKDSAFDKDNSSSIRPSKPTRSLPQALLGAAVFDIKQLLFSISLSSLCIASLFIIILLIGDKAHNENLGIYTDKLSSPLSSINMSGRCIFIYRLFYFIWELDCRAALNEEILGIGTYFYHLCVLVMEFGAAAGILASTDFNPRMGEALLTLLASMYLGNLIRELLEPSFRSDVLMKGFINPVCKR